MSTSGLTVLKGEQFVTGAGICVPFGSKVEVSKIVFASGGGGTNAAVTFARQGLKTACVGVIGQDANGKALLDELRREGVDAKYFQVHDDDITAYSVILVSRSGERTILSYKGEGQHWQQEKIPFNRLKTKWMYLDSLGGDWDMLERSVHWARDNGVKLATNPGGKELAHGLQKLRPLLGYFQVVAMNQEEASRLTGIAYEKTDEIFRAMDDVIGGLFIMTKGHGGSIVSDGRKVYEAGIPEQRAVERTGAGDAFNSAFVAEYSRSGDIVRAMQLATANASSVVMKYGAKEGILHRGSLGPWAPVGVSVRDL
ncbi:MAG TPA: carbohydrate kinase family protein [Candidatus Paceibacterota bacterium]|nr:carbohydrate kinase family protein [Candidatus Paceibacterota bacterium]